MDMSAPLTFGIGSSPRSPLFSGMRQQPVPLLFSGSPDDQLEIPRIDRAVSKQDAHDASRFSNRVFADDLKNTVSRIAAQDQLSEDFVRKQQEQSRERFFEGLLGDPRRALLMMKRGDEIQGIIALKQFEYGSPVVDLETRQGWVTDLTTASDNPMLQGRLLLKALDVAKKAGYTHVHCSATPQEKSFFKAAGFHPWCQGENKKYPQAVQQLKWTEPEKTLMVKTL